jgi:hypothetical protein
MDELVEKYLELREAKAQLKAKYDTAKGGIDTSLAAIEARILDEFNKSGLESARTAHGTAYKNTRTSASVADWDATLKFIQDNQLWNMLERRVSKDAVVQWRDEHNDLPPGLNWREEITINVRRS